MPAGSKSCVTGIHQVKNFPCIVLSCLKFSYSENTMCATCIAKHQIAMLNTPHQHGTVQQYKAGCKCHPCLAANARYKLTLKHRSTIALKHLPDAVHLDALLSAVLSTLYYGSPDQKTVQIFNPDSNKLEWVLHKVTGDLIDPILVSAVDYLKNQEVTDVGVGSTEDEMDVQELPSEAVSGQSGGTPLTWVPLQLPGAS